MGKKHIFAIIKDEVRKKKKMPNVRNKYELADSVELWRMTKATEQTNRQNPENDRREKLVD